jgi:FkbM family methyltransferase
MSDGSSIQSRLIDAGGLLSVHVDRDYDVPGMNWSAARTILDVGANVGSFTIWAARRSPGARLVAIEPNPETFSLLEANIRENGLQDRVMAINAAVGLSAGLRSLEFVAHSLGTRLARDGTTGPTIRVQTLEGILVEAGLDYVDFLKMDCEGMEYVVLGGAGAEGLRAVRVIACEYHAVEGHDVNELDELLRVSGFRVSRPDDFLGVIWAVR